MNRILLTLTALIFSVNSDAGMENRVKNESQSHLKRIEILQQAEKCIQAAKTKADYKACEKQEKAARQTFQQQRFTQRKAALIQRFTQREQWLQKKRQCVEQAQTPKALKQCMRHHK